MPAPTFPLISAAGDEVAMLMQLQGSPSISPSNAGQRRAQPARGGGATMEPTFTIRELKAMKYMFDELPSDGMTMQTFVQRVGPEFIRLSPLATNRDIELLFKRIDANANGTVDWDEFSAFLLMNDVKSTLKLTAEAKSKDFAPKPTSKESLLSAHHALRHILHKEPMHRMLVHPKYSKYFTASADGMVKMWNADNLRHMQTLQAASNAAISDISLTPWFDTLAVAAMDNTISFYNCDTGDLMRCYKGERGSRVGGKLRGGELLFNDQRAVVHRPQFAIPVNREVGDDIKYGRLSHVFGKVDTTVPVLEHFKKPKEVPAISLSHFGTATEGRRHVPVQAGYPSAINVCTIHNETMMLVGFDNGYMQMYPLTGGSQGPGHHVSAGLGGGGTNEMVYENPKTTIKMHWDFVSRLISVPQMDLLLSSSYDGMIQVRSFDRLDEVSTLLGDGVVSNDYRSAIGAQGTMVRDPGLYGHTHRVTGLDWNFESRLIASCAPEKDVLIWSPYIPKPITKLTHPKGTVRCVQFMKGNDQILTLSTDNVVRLWDVRTYRCVQALEDTNATEDVSYAQYDHRRECVVLGSSCLRRWGLVQTTDYHRKYCGHRRPVVGLVVSLPFRQVITADHRMIVVWNIETLEAVMRWEVDDSIADMCLDSNCRRLMVATLNGNILVFNYVNGLLLKTYNPGGFEELHRHFGQQRGTTGSAVVTTGVDKVVFAGNPEVTSLCFADVSKPRPTSVILATLDDGLTAVFLDEEGGEGTPFRTLRVSGSSLTSAVDSAYSLLILGHHGGISGCSLDESTTAVTPFKVLPPDVASHCKVALFVGHLMEEPVVATRWYLQRRDAIIHGTAAAVPVPMQEAIHQAGSPSKRPPDGGAHVPTRSKSLRRKSSMAMVVEDAIHLAATHAVAGEEGKDPFGNDLDAQQLQSLGLVEKIVVMQSIEPHIVVTGSSDGLVQLWDGRAMCELLRFRATPVTDAVTCMCFTHGEGALLVADNSGYVSIFDMSEVQEESYQRQLSQSVGRGGAPGPLSPPSLRPEMIHLRVRFRAHGESISAIGLDEGIVPKGVHPGFNRRKSVAAAPLGTETMSQEAQRQAQREAMEADMLAAASSTATDKRDSTARRRSFFQSPSKDDAEDDDEDLDPPNDPLPAKQSFFQQPVVVAPDGTHVKVFTSSSDTYSFVWLMHRRSCEVQLVACLGDPVFKPSVPRHHPQVIQVFDTVRCRLIHRYLVAERKCTWGMVVAHFARVVEQRRVSLFSASSVGPDVAIPYTASFEDVDMLAVDDDSGDDDDDEDADADDVAFRDAEAASLDSNEGSEVSTRNSSERTLSVKSLPAKGMPHFATLPSTNSIARPSKKTTTMGGGLSMFGRRLDKKGSSKRSMNGRHLQKDVAYIKSCRQAFDKTTHDESTIEALLKRLLTMMTEPSSGRDRMAGIDDDGFYFALVIPTVANPSDGDSNKAGGKSLLQQRASVHQRRATEMRRDTTQHRSSVANLGTTTLLDATPSVAYFMGGSSLLDDTPLKNTTRNDSEIVEMVRPPRHVVPYTKTRALRDPPDLDEDPLSARTVLVGMAASFTGVKSVHRNTGKHPFVTQDTLAERGEQPFVHDPTSSTTDVVLTPSEKQSPMDVASLAEGAAGPSSTFLTELRHDRYNFMKSVMSFSSTPNNVHHRGSSPRNTGGTSPRGVGLSSNGSITPRMGTLRSRGGLSMLYDDETFALPTTTPRDDTHAPPNATDSEGSLLGTTPMGHYNLVDPVPGGEGVPSGAKGASDDDTGSDPPAPIPRLSSSAKGGGGHTSATASSMALVPLAFPPRRQPQSADGPRRPQTTTESCRLQVRLLDDMVKVAMAHREELAAASRRLHHGCKPTWEPSDLLQRQLRRGGDGGGYVTVQGEEQTREVRQLRSAVGGRQRLQGGGRRAQVVLSSGEKDIVEQAHLDRFRDRAVALVGEDVVHHRILQGDTEQARDDATTPTTDEEHHRGPRGNLGDPAGSEVLGDLQWVSRIHSHLEVPRTFQLVPAPPILEAMRSSDMMKLRQFNENDEDQGWIRMLSTARAKKSTEAVIMRAKKRGTPNSARSPKPQNNSPPVPTSKLHPEKLSPANDKQPATARGAVKPAHPHPPPGARTGPKQSAAAN